MLVRKHKSFLCSHAYQDYLNRSSGKIRTLSKDGYGWATTSPTKQAREALHIDRGSGRIGTGR